MPNPTFSIAVLATIVSVASDALADQFDVSHDACELDAQQSVSQLNCDWIAEPSTVSDFIRVHSPWSTPDVLNRLNNWDVTLDTIIPERHLFVSNGNVGISDVNYSNVEAAPETESVASGVEICEDAFRAFEQGINGCVQAGSGRNITVSDLFRLEGEEWIRFIHEKHGLVLPEDDDALLVPGAWYIVGKI